MNLDKHARPIFAVVILITMLLAALSYVLPGTFAAYLFPGLAQVSTTERPTRVAYPGYQLSVYALNVPGARPMQMTS